MNKIKCVLKMASCIALLALLAVVLITYILIENIELEKVPDNFNTKENNELEARKTKNEEFERKPFYRVGKLHLSLGREMDFQLKSVTDDNQIKLRGVIGVGIKDELGKPNFCKDSLHCLSWKSKIKLLIKRTNSRCHVFIWKSIAEELLMDCFSFGDDNWFGGPENANQLWPVEELDLQAQPYLSQENQFMSISERYWLTSNGVYIYVDETAPLFVDTSYYKQNSICFIAKDSPPYLPRDNIRFKYTICQFDDPRTAHEHALKYVLKTPSDIPDIKMIQYPIWSTWVKFQQNVKDTDIINFAENITKHGFNHSQIEIDDNWETCYGSKEFNRDRFKNITELVKILKQNNFRITLWTHPFVNTNCKLHKSLMKKGYFAKNHKGSTKTTWWNGEASVIDFTNLKAKDWFKNEHYKLMNKTGIDGFKFDAGETSWLPQVCILNSSYIKQPNIYTKEFAETAAEFGKISEVRVGHKTQNLPIFVRMLDKDSRWTFDNGLPTLITTLLVLNMVGYNWVLPDMVGGNGYMTPVTKELFIRWLQANTFMPTIQFSAAPFDYDNQTIEISKKFTTLHFSYSKKIIELMKKTVKTGTPLNPPIWWVDPKNPTAHAINSEYLLGEDILVAPVIEEYAVQRDVYLPLGLWQDGNNPKAVYKGRQWLKDYPADINTLPYFIKIDRKNKKTLHENREFDDDFTDKVTYLG